MVARAVLVDAGLLLLGIVLLVVGALLEPVRSGVGPTSAPGSVAGESLIAIGLTLILGAIGYFLAWGNPT